MRSWATFERTAVRPLDWSRWSLPLASTMAFSPPSVATTTRWSMTAVAVFSLRVEAVVDALVGALDESPFCLASSACGLVVVRGGDDRGVVGVLAVVQRGDGEADAVAQPRLDVVLEGDVVALAACVEQLLDLRAGVVGAQDLLQRALEVAADLAVGAHDALDVERGAGGDERGRIVARLRSRWTSRSRRRWRRTARAPGSGRAGAWSSSPRIVGDGSTPSAGR